MEIGLGGYGKKTKRLVKGTVKEVRGTVRDGTDMIGSTVAGGAHLVGKRAKQGVKIVGKTELGGTLIDGATLIGGTGTKIVGKGGKFIGGTLTDGATMITGTLTDGTKILADGTKILGNTVLMGTDLVAGGLQHLLGDGGLDDDVFFEKSGVTEETFDDDFDEVLPSRFQKAEKQKTIRDSLRVEWNEVDWDQMEVEPEYVPRISVEKTAGEKKMEVAAEEQQGEETSDEDAETSDDDDGSNSSDDEDMYFTEEELKAKQEEEKRLERKQKKKKKKKNGSDDGSDSSDDEFGALGKNLLAAYEHGRTPEESSTSATLVEYGSPLQETKALGAARMSVFSSMLSNSNAMNNVNPLQSSSTLPPFAEEGGDEELNDLYLTAAASSGHLTTDIEMKLRVQYLWSKLRNHVRANSAAKAFTSTMKKNQEFFSVFDEDEVQNGDPVQAANKALREERAAEKRRVKQLLKQLDDYETNLAEERKIVKEERARVSKEKAELESTLNVELEKNQALETQLREIEAELNCELQAEREAVIQRSLEELRAENDVIQKHLAQQDVTLRQLHREKAIREKKEKQRQSYQGFQFGGQEMKSSGTSLSSGSMLFSVDDDATVATYITRSRSSTNIKMMQDDLDEMNGELQSRHKIIDVQVSELEQLRKDLRELEEKNGIKPLKEKLMSLEEQKKELEDKCSAENAELRQELDEKVKTATKFTAEISKLKLEQTKREMKKETQAEQPETGGGGLFGWFTAAPPLDESNDAEVALTKLGL